MAYYGDSGSLRDQATPRYDGEMITKALGGMRIGSSRELVVGIDFGTYGTGIAYKLRSADSSSACSSWPGMPPPGYVKTLSAILYQGRQPIAWGWEARNRYRELDDNQRRRGEYVYLEQFKLALDRDSGYRLPQGFTPVQVIADFLRMFKAHCLKLLGDLYASVGQVQWCLTVPAIWKDDQKDAMRRAACLAGLIDREDSTKLSIIMEPEAAMLHAHGVRDLGSMAAGETVMMVDAGGGTVDLTAHTIRRGRDGRVALEEAAPGVGGFCGSTYVDKNFEAWFRSEVGAADFDAWKGKHYAEYQQVMSSWEMLKRRFKTTMYTSEVIYLPESGLLPGRDGSDRVSITLAQMKGFFRPQIDQVVTLVRKLAKSCPSRRVSKILLAGGFSMSSYFVTSLREQLVDVCHAADILVPDEPASIIMHGAVAYASSPDVIISRRMRLAYGVEYWRRSERADPEAAKVKDTSAIGFSTRYKTHAFERVVKRGDLVAPGHVETVERVPFDDNKDTLIVELYATPNNDAEFIATDRGMTRVAQLTVAVTPGMTDTVVVTLVFGLQELTMSAVNERTRKKLTTTTAFSQNSFI